MNPETAKNPAVLQAAGLAALTAALGERGTVEFLEQYRNEPQRGIPGRDFTKERRTWPEQSNEEIRAKIMKIAEDDFASGRLDGKNVIHC